MRLLERNRFYKSKIGNSRGNSTASGSDYWGGGGAKKRGGEKGVLEVPRREKVLIGLVSFKDDSKRIQGGQAIVNWVRIIGSEHRGAKE